MGSSAIGFFSLPLDIRNNIDRRVLILQHTVNLFQDYGARVETFAPDRPFRWLSLLHVNQRMHEEAISVLYGGNTFKLVDSKLQQAGLLQAFLDCIGPVNAGLLSYLCINFPVAESSETHPGVLRLRDESLQSLELLQKDCTSLRTVELLIYSNASGYVIETYQDSLQSNREWLSHVHAHLMAIPSCEKVIVRVNCALQLPPVLAEPMQELGWVILHRHRTAN